VGIRLELFYSALTTVHHHFQTDVELSIPDKKEVVLYAPLTKCQKDLYAGIVDRTLHAKLNGATKGDTPLADKRGGGKQTDYREVSDREYFNRLDADDAAESVDEVAPDTVAAPTSIVNLKMTNVVMQLRKAANHPFLIEWPLDKKGEAVADNRLVTQSGKMMVLDRLLTRLKVEGHQVSRSYDTSLI
jgi:ATP-dependent DNA helicase